MKTAEFTTRDELYTFLDKMPHDEGKTAGEQIMSSSILATAYMTLAGV